MEKQTWYNDISWTITKCHEISWHTMTYHKTSWHIMNVMKHRKMSWNIEVSIVPYCCQEAFHVFQVSQVHDISEGNFYVFGDHKLLLWANRSGSKSPQKSWMVPCGLLGGSRPSWPTTHIRSKQRPSWCSPSPAEVLNLLTASAETWDTSVYHKRHTVIVIIIM